MLRAGIREMGFCRSKIEGLQESQLGQQASREHWVGRRRGSAAASVSATPQIRTEMNEFKLGN